MNAKRLSMAAIASFFCISAFAAPPSDAPAGTTGQCNDGSYTSAAVKSGACNGHKGVKEWYTAAAAPTPAVATPAVVVPTKAAPAPAAAPVAASAAKAAQPAAFKPAANAAAGGGPGLVWVNTNSKAYHCMGDKWYGKTKKGEYMKEADAKAKGFHGPHGKDCAS